MFCSLSSTSETPTAHTCWTLVTYPYVRLLDIFLLSNDLFIFHLFQYFLSMVNSGYFHMPGVPICWFFSSSLSNLLNLIQCTFQVRYIFPNRHDFLYVSRISSACLCVSYLSEDMESVYNNCFNHLLVPSAVLSLLLFLMSHIYPGYCSYFLFYLSGQIILDGLMIIMNLHCILLKFHCISWTNTACYCADS